MNLLFVDARFTRPKAMKNGARLAPPAAATMIGRGQVATLVSSPFLGSHPFSVIHCMTASCNDSSVRGPGALPDSMRRTEWLSPRTTASNPIFRRPILRRIGMSLAECAQPIWGFP
jgi:hypothetical protein